MKDICHITIWTVIISIILGTLVLSGCDFMSSEPPHDYIQNAKRYIETEKVYESILESKKALQIDPNLPEARWLLGSAYLKLGNGAAALKEMEKAQGFGFNRPEIIPSILRAILLKIEPQRVLDYIVDNYNGDTMNEALYVIKGKAYIGLKRFADAKSSFELALKNNPDSIDARLGLAEVAIFNKNKDIVKRYLIDALDLEPGNINALLFDGRLSLSEGRFDQAELAYRKVLEVAGYKIIARLGLAQALLSLDKIEEAIKQIESVERRYPKHPLTKYLRAYIAFQANDNVKAKDYLRETLRVVPGHVRSLLLLSTISHNEGQIEQSVEYLTRFISLMPDYLPALKLLAFMQMESQQPNQAIATLEKAYEIYRDDPQLLALLGSAYVRIGEQERGEQFLKIAIQLSPDSTTIRTELAISHLASGEIKDAINQIESIVELNPELIQLDILLVLSYIKNGDFDAAIASAKSMRVKDPGNPMPHNLLGMALHSNGDKENALKEFEEALRLDPEYISAISNIAKMKIQEDKLDEAKNLYNKILMLDKANLQAFLNLANIESVQGNRENMYELLQEARINNPQSLAPRLLIANYLKQTGNPRELLNVMKEAEEQNPNQPEAKFMLAQAYRLNGKYSDALSILEPLAERWPDSIDILFEKSLVHYELSDVTAAKQSLDKLLRLEPEHYQGLVTSIGLALLNEDQNSAKSILDKIKETFPESKDIDLLQGDIFLTEGKYSNAIRLYENSLKTYENRISLSKLADAYAAKGDHEKTKTLLEGWLHNHPEDNEIKFILAFHLEHVDSGESIRLYKEILKNTPDNSMALNNLAGLYINIDREYSYQLVSKAHKLSPNRGEILDTLGWVLVKQDKVESGLPYLQSALYMLPNSPDIHYHLAAALVESRQIERAKQELESLLDKGNEFKSKAAAEQLLRDIQ